MPWRSATSGGWLSINRLLLCHQTSGAALQPQLCTVACCVGTTLRGGRHPVHAARAQAQAPPCCVACLIGPAQASLTLHPLCSRLLHSICSRLSAPPPPPHLQHQGGDAGAADGPGGSAGCKGHGVSHILLGKTCRVWYFIQPPCRVACSGQLAYSQPAGRVCGAASQRYLPECALVHCFSESGSILFWNPLRHC